ncbi:MAG: alpha/beta fold hydrolase [Congregibacter sp.]
MGGRGEKLLFAHANGYPPESYRQLFDNLAGQFAINAIEHRPLWGGRVPPKNLRWQLFVDDLLAAMRGLGSQAVWVMGHSMGATIATFAAARHPEMFKGLILMDPVFLPGRFIWSTRLIPKRHLNKLPMVRKALNRPEYFASLDDAFAFYRPKTAFRDLSDAALRDYVAASKSPVDDKGVRLRYSGDWEAAVYRTVPHVKAAIRRLEVNTLGLRGSASDTLNLQMWQRWQRWQPKARLLEVPGGHLFPLEYPREAAESVLDHVFPQLY